MAWTYTNDPTNVQLDAVRLLIGDVLSADPQMTDEELNYLISVEGTTRRAAIAACRAQIALFSRLIDKAVGDLKFSYSQRAAAYRETLKGLEAQAERAAIGVIATGQSRSRKDVMRDDSDAVQHPFEIGQFDMPGGASDVSDLTNT